MNGSLPKWPNEHRLPGYSGQVCAESLDESSPRPGSRGARWVMHGMTDLVLCGNGTYCSAIHQGVVEALVLAQVCPLQIKHRQFRVVPFQAVAFSHAVEQLILGDPVESISKFGGVMFEQVKHFGPCVDDLNTLGIGDLVAV